MRIAPAMLRLASDHGVYWPLLLSFAWPMALILCWSGSDELAFFGTIAVVVLWGTTAISGLILSLLWMIARTWLRSVATLVLPLSTLAAGLHFHTVWQAAQWAGGQLHLGVMRPFYLREIARLPADAPKLTTFYWDSTYVAVYDESDEVLSLHPSEAWKERAARSGLDFDIAGGWPASGHFYLVAVVSQ